MEENYKDSVVNFLSLFRYSSRLDKLLIFIGLIAGICRSCIFTILSYILGNLVSTFVDYHSADGSISNSSINGIEWKSEKDNESILNTTAQYAVHTAILGIALLCFYYIMVSCFSITATNQALTIKCLFMKAVLRQDIAWFDTNNTGDFAALITGNMKRIQEGIGVNFIMLVCSILESIISLSAAFYFGWHMTLVVLAIIPIVLIIMAIISKLQAKATAREKSANSMAGSVAEEVLSAIRTVVAFGGEEKEINRYEAHALITKAQGIKRGLITSIQIGLVAFCVFLMSATALWYGARRVILQRIKDNPDFNANNLVNVPSIDSSSNDGKIPMSIKGDITLKNVCFSYPSRPEISVLNGFTLKIKSGETVALVGSSGCGKSTVMQLIQRFYDVDAGYVKIDGHNIKDVNIGWLRGNIGLVGQEPVLFATTIADNIRYGNSDATQAKIESAARAANVHEFILTLPKGYNTIIGESGTQLSGGQKQRIAIARALVKDPKILLLDEATSSLDAASELTVQMALDKASQKKTTIIVTHRLSTIRLADKIVAMADGQIKEIGTHDELMAAKGIYYQLVITQNTLNDEVNDLHYEGELLRSVENDIKTIVYARKLSRSERVSFEFVPKTLEMDDDDNTKPGTMTLLKFSLPELPYILFGAICAFFTGVGPTLYGILFGDILQLLSIHGDEVLSDIQYYSLLYIGLAVVIGISSFMQTFMFTIVGEALTSRIKKMAFSTMIYQDISWFDCPENNTGSLCSKLSSNASDVQGIGGARLSTMLRAFSTLVAAIVIGLYFNWKIALIALPSVPFILVTTYLENIMISKRLYKENSEIDDASKVAIEAIQNIRTVASLHQEEHFYTQFKCALLSSLKKSAAESHIRGLVFGFSQSISTFVYAISIYYGSIEIVHGNMLYGDYFKIMEAVFLGSKMISHVVAFSPDYQKAKTATLIMFQLLRQKPIIDKDSPKAHVLENWSGRVEFKNVHFNYPSRPSVKILKGFDLKVEPGKTMALVGSSGSGKSTCVQLIERFYEPDRGELKVDGKSTKSLRVPSMRSQISLVSQEPVLFNYSLAENIAYGDNKRNVPIDEIISAAKNANIHDFISSLTQGYSTIVGDKGIQLSGGQKQRIAIARALIRNPKLLLLDEATSALDAESEKVVQEALERACSGRTCIVIAHRLNTLQSADVIVVIQKGRVVEQGTHQELLNLHGHYYNLYNVQNKNK